VDEYGPLHFRSRAHELAHIGKLTIPHLSFEDVHATTIVMRPVSIADNDTRESLGRAVQATTQHRVLCAGYEMGVDTTCISVDKIHEFIY
jgi:hypothetical protein